MEKGLPFRYNLAIRKRLGDEAASAVCEIFKDVYMSTLAVEDIRPLVAERAEEGSGQSVLLYNTYLQELLRQVAEGMGRDARAPSPADQQLEDVLADQYDEIEVFHVQDNQNFKALREHLRTSPFQASRTDQANQQLEVKPLLVLSTIHVTMEDMEFLSEMCEPEADSQFVCTLWTAHVGAEYGVILYIPDEMETAVDYWNQHQDDLSESFWGIFFALVQFRNISHLQLDGDGPQVEGMVQNDW